MTVYRSGEMRVVVTRRGIPRKGVTLRGDSGVEFYLAPVLYTHRFHYKYPRRSDSPQILILTPDRSKGRCISEADTRDALKLARIVVEETCVNTHLSLPDCFSKDFKILENVFSKATGNLLPYFPDEMGSFRDAYGVVDVVPNSGKALDRLCDAIYYTDGCGHKISFWFRNTSPMYLNWEKYEHLVCDHHILCLPPGLNVNVHFQTPVSFIVLRNNNLSPDFSTVSFPEGGNWIGPFHIVFECDAEQADVVMPSMSEDERQHLEGKDAVFVFRFRNDLLPDDVSFLNRAPVKTMVIVSPQNFSNVSKMLEDKDVRVVPVAAQKVNGMRLKWSFDNDELWDEDEWPCILDV